VAQARAVQEEVMMREWVKHYGVTLCIFLVLDGIWLGLVVQPFYQAQLGFLLAPRANWATAAGFYLLYVAGLVFFVVAPARRAGQTAGQAARRRAFFGLVTYATYDLTNLATVAAGRSG
jgi:uncharacterized membrane protein